MINEEIVSYKRKISKLRSVHKFLYIFMRLLKTGDKINFMKIELGSCHQDYSELYNIMTNDIIS